MLNNLSKLRHGKLNTCPQVFENESTISLQQNEALGEDKQ
jgi:hypothetical protein